jgi:dGTPase
MHDVQLEIGRKKMVETLKHLTYEALIMSPRLKLVEFRGMDIVKEIFRAIDGKGGDRLLPDDCREGYRRVTSEAAKRRVICDYIAGMTDNYALNFFARLKSADPMTIFKPYH